MNLPNKLSILRILLIPLMVAVFLIQAIPYRYLIVAIIFTISSITDFLDGYIARKYNLVTDLGKFLDPIADKILVLTSLILVMADPTILCGGFASTGILTKEYAFLLYQISGVIGVSIIVARELIVTVLRMIASSKGIVLSAEKVGKIKTFVTDVAICLLFVACQFITTKFGVIIYFIAFALYVFSVILTAYSGVYYLVKNKGMFKQ